MAVRLFCLCVHPKGKGGGIEGTSTLIFNLGTRWFWVVSALPWQLYPLKETRYPV